LKPHATILTNRSITEDNETTHPVVGFPMADLPLSVSERKRLIQMIARRGAVDTYNHQRNFVENCGLELISERLPYGETPGNFAQILIRESQQAGMIGNPPEHALRQVLQYVREELMKGHPDELPFIDTLLGRSLPESNPSSQPLRPQTAPSLKVASLGTKATTTTPLKSPSPLATRLPKLLHLRRNFPSFYWMCGGTARQSCYSFWEGRQDGSWMR
jgi:hypothetical protein